MLLLAAAAETNLLSCLETALTANYSTTEAAQRVARSHPATICGLLLTLLFLPAVGLRRLWDMRGYTGQALALLSDRPRAYGYRHTERFLAELAQLRADGPLTKALARWTAALWKPGLAEPAQPVPVFYVDGHKQPVHRH